MKKKLIIWCLILVGIYWLALWLMFCVDWKCAVALALFSGVQSGYESLSKACKRYMENSDRTDAQGWPEN